MSKSEKVWLVIAACLILIGCVLLGGVMTMLNWDVTKLSTTKYETNNHEINEPFHAISVHTDTADVTFVASENAGCSVVCYEQKNVKHTVMVKDGTLVIEVDDTRAWHEHIGIQFGTPKITIYLPQGEYGTLSIKSATGDVKIPNDFTFQSIDVMENTGDVTNEASALESINIKTSTGSICVKGISARSLDLSVSTGNVKVSDVTCEGDVSVDVSTGKVHLINISCKNVLSEGSTGDILLKNVLATDAFSVERSTGDVNLESCDAAQIFIETDTGDVEGSLLSEKVFIIDTETGEKDVPNTMSGGRCEISTDTGDIEIRIQR